MREWGNQKANAYYIPNPELYLIPSKNDNDMEVFIREKYEKKAFMNPITCKSKFKIGAVVHEDPKLLEKYHLELWRLKDMGYINQDMSLYALKMFSGNILKASEWLTTQPGAKVTSALTTPRGSISDEPVVRFNGGIRQPSISSEGGPPSPTQNNFTFIPSSLPPISQGKEANQDFFGAFNGQTASVQQSQASFPQQAQAGFSQQSQGAFSQQTQQASAPQTDFFSMVSSNNSAFGNEPPVTSQQSRMQQQISTAPPVYKSRDELADVFSFDAKPAFVAVSASAARKESVGPLAGLSGVFSESENAVKVNKKKDDILALFNAAPLQNNVQSAFAPQVANPFQTQPQQQVRFLQISILNLFSKRIIPFLVKILLLDNKFLSHNRVSMVANNLRLLCNNLNRIHLLQELRNSHKCLSSSKTSLETSLSEVKLLTTLLVKHK